MEFDVRKALITAIFCFCIIQLPLLGQPAIGALHGYSMLVKWAYGQDQELVNGLQYYNRHPRSMGHPYLMEGWAHQGSVTIRGKLYSDIWLKYDIHVQQVQVEYRTMNGADNQVILVGDRIDEFTIGEHYFRKMNLGEEQAMFYQVLGEGRMVWYICWEKKLVPVSGDSRFIEEYTSAKRSYLLELDGSINAFHNKKSFVKLFPIAIQKDMKRLIKMNQLHIRTTSPEQLELFILAATNLFNGGGD